MTFWDEVFGAGAEPREDKVVAGLWDPCPRGLLVNQDSKVWATK